VQIGIISDTHGKLSQTAYDALKGSDAIIHAGDIGASSVLFKLETIAPVTAVLGNCDRSDYGPYVTAVATPVFAEVRFKVVHKPKDIGSLAPYTKVIVTGHTHVPKIEEVAGMTLVNPGSASEPRAGNPPTVAIMQVERGQVKDVHIVEIGRSGKPAEVDL
jgi:putative phosphoesterase